MKPQINNHRASFLSKMFFILLCILLLTFKKGISQDLPAQKGNMGIGLFSGVSCDGYGIEYLPNIYYKNKRSSYFVAPTIQKQKANLSGIQAIYQYALTGREVPGPLEGELELFVFAIAGYHHNAMLGKALEWDEQKSNPLYTENKIYQDRFTSVEAFVGVGLNIPFLKRFKWTNCIGVGGYTSFNYPTNFTDKFYYSPHAIGCLMLRTGI